MTDVEAELRLAQVQDTLAGVYSLERVLGQGGMGTVYLGRDVALDRPVAIKVLDHALAKRADQRARFLAEARTGARLSHPNVVPIFTVDEINGMVFFVMGLVDGESLAHRIHQQGPVAPAEANRILRDIGWALGYAHAMGVLHRDVTLDNILIERSTGRALLADFGIAAEIERTEDAPLIGTPAYIAPELVQGDAATVRSDLYALGICGWTMMAGRFPYIGDDAGSVLLQHVTAPVPSLAAAAPATPSQLVAAIERSLAKQPADRQQNVEAFLDALERRGSGTSLAPPLARWVGRWERIRPAWAFAMPMMAMLTMQTFPDLFWAIARADRSAYVKFTFVLMTVLRPLLLVPATTLLLQGIFEFRELRRVLRAGYGISDLLLAMQRHRREKDRDAPPVLGRVVHDVTWLAVLGMAVMFLFARRTDSLASGSEQARDIAAVFLDIARWFWVLLWTGLGASFVVPVSPVRLGQGLRLAERFWKSRLGSLVSRVAGFGLGRNSGPEHTLHRPTELVLDLAIEDLWSALPDATRQGLKELPAVAESLRERVAEMKELTRQLGAPTLVEVPEAVALRERLQLRQEAGITALERLRMQLARLSGEAEPAGQLTEQLRDARALEGELLTELGGHPSLKRLLKQKTGSSALTPALST